MAMALHILNTLKLGPLSLAALLSFPYQAVAYYCDHNLCGIEQYCCGDNLCCDYVYSLWYFWVGVALFVLIISACGGFYRYFYDNQQYRVVPYFQSLADNDKSHSQYLVNKNSFNAQDTMDYSCLPPDSRHLDNKSHPPFRSESDKKSYMFV